MLVPQMPVHLHGQSAAVFVFEPARRGSEFDLLGHRLAMLVAKVPVGFHGQGPAVFVPEPSGNRWDVHARFNAPGCEQMPEVMVGETRNSNLFARPRK